MAFNSQAGSSSQAFQTPPFAHQQQQQQHRGTLSFTRSQSNNNNNNNNNNNININNSPLPLQFDIIEWYPQFQSCLRYFLDHAQHEDPVQALAAFINIQLPFQKQSHPVTSSHAFSPRAGGQEVPHHRPHGFPSNPQQAQAVSLLPYIRRLVVTGHDTPAILHGFFGDAWQAGIGSLHEIERRNYMFAAKSTNWLKVKQAYDMGPDETVPFLSPLKDAGEKEIQQAESTWSEWLAMQDWMLGPRSPEMRNEMRSSPRVKRESRD